MRVMIVDDNALVRRAVGKLFAPESSWELCGEASNCAEALRKAQKLRPDVVLLDMSMPGTHGLEAVRLFREEMPDAKIVVMSQNDEPAFCAAVTESGGNACVDKSSLSLDLLASVINGVAR